ncbi:MAG: VCBS repeat-containing protein [Balneolales bacterium]
MQKRRGTYIIFTFVVNFLVMLWFTTSCAPQKNVPSQGILKGSLVLEKNVIDSQVEEGDGQSLADIDGDGSNNIIIGTGDGGEVYWYKKSSSTEWSKHLIADGFIEIEGTIAADFNNDGLIEVIILDQATADPSQPNVYIAKQDTDDPTEAWSVSVLDKDAPHVQQGISYDVNENGFLDFVYAYEGATNGEGGFYWLENNGGNPVISTNWTKHEIGKMDGAWWIDYNSPKDFNNNGNSGDILVSARSGGRSPSAARGGIFIFFRPQNPTDLWEKMAIDTSFTTLHVSSGNLTKNGDDRDIVAGASHDSDDFGLYIYDFSNGWKKIELESDHNWWGTYAFDINKNGNAEIISGERTDNTIRIYAYNETQKKYILQVSDSLLKPDDQIIFDDINKNGHVTDFFVGSDPDGLFWYETFKFED